MKYLLIIVAILVAWWVLKKKPRRPAREPERGAAEPEKMVACAHCGVNVPVSDSVAEGGAHYCGEAHRLAARAARRP